MSSTSKFCSIICPLVTSGCVTTAVNTGVAMVKAPLSAGVELAKVPLELGTSVLEVPANAGASLFNSSSGLVETGTRAALTGQHVASFGTFIP